MDCSLPDSSIHRISQARILEWLAISYSRSSSDPGSNCCHWCLYVSCFGRQNEFFTTEPPGKPSGFTSRVQEVASECESMHCVIYREMLASQKKKKKKSPKLNNVLQNVIKIISHIKVHALNSYLFTQLCEAMDSEYTHLLLYMEVRWLSKVDHWPELLNYESYSRDLEETSPPAAHFSDTKSVKTCLFV